MRRFFWDTMIFAYWLEDHATFGRRVEEMHSNMQRRGDVLCSSLLVLGELLVGPMKTGQMEAAKQLQQYFASNAIELIDYSLGAALRFADLRARQGLKSLDALHLATAVTGEVDVFVTNDKRLQKVGLQQRHTFIASIDNEIL